MLRQQGAAVAATLVMADFMIHAYGVFDHTINETSHLAEGLAWFEKSTYTLQYQHPH